MRTTSLALLSLAPSLLALPSPETHKVGPALSAELLLKRSMIADAPVEPRAIVDDVLVERDEEPHLERRQAAASCKVTSDCFGKQTLPWASTHLCYGGKCTYKCNAGYTKNGYLKSCVKNAATTTTSTSSTAIITTSLAQSTTTPASSSSTRTTTTAPAATTTSSANAAVKSISLKRHNDFRAKYDTPPLVWDDTLAAAAQTWANKCEFRHSQGEVGPYGENLSATTGYASTIGDGIGFWEDEAPDYDRNNPIYSHFTQMVWRSTTKLGCAEALCPPGSIFDGKYGNERFYVCEYSPPGNAGNAANYRANINV